MFDGATEFNHTINDWDLSSGIQFVSTERSFGFLFNIYYACDLIDSSI
jgi:hypothetical protein